MQIDTAKGIFFTKAQSTFQVHVWYFQEHKQNLSLDKQTPQQQQQQHKYSVQTVQDLWQAYLKKSS